MYVFGLTIDASRFSISSTEMCYSWYSCIFFATSSSLRLFPYLFNYLKYSFCKARVFLLRNLRLVWILNFFCSDFFFSIFLLSPSNFCPNTWHEYEWFVSEIQWPGSRIKSAAYSHWDIHQDVRGHTLIRPYPLSNRQ